jgi:P4 family phage/plasmid primase-like protien
VGSRKVPHYTNCHRRHGTQGSADDRAALATLAQARAAYAAGTWDGIGFATLHEFGVVALDFDHCVVDGEVAPWVLALCAGTYHEYSPSGNGVRAFYLGELDDGKTSQVEVFHAHGFVTVTGNVHPDCELFGADVAPLPEHVRAEWHRRHPPVDEIDATLHGPVDLDDLDAALAHLDADEYESWVAVGQALKPLGDADGLPRWLAFSARSPKFDDDEARRKWHRDLKGDRTGPAAIFARAQRAGWSNPRKAHCTDRSDLGNANSLATLSAGNLRYVAETRRFLWWDGERWTVDNSGSLAHAQRVLVAEHHESAAVKLQREAEAATDPDARKRLAKAAASLREWATSCRNKGRLDSMAALAALDPRVSIGLADLDRDPWLLGVQNGVVDLRTGELRPAGRDDLVTKLAAVPYRAGAHAPRWRTFVSEITGVGKREWAPRPALARYLQKFAGYALTGSTAEQKMAIFVGAGSNGKNVFLDTLKRLAGDYWVSIPPEALMTTRHEGDAERPSPVLASLAGARLAISSESKDGQKLDVGLVKRHTGGGFMTARQMRENSFQFEITHKLVLMTNYRPALDHLDDAMRGRLHLIPFDRVWNRPGHTDRDPTLPDGDKDLPAKLALEAEGVLAWAIEGAVLYHRQGLTPPDEVVALTREYFSEADALGQWLLTVQRCAAKDGTTPTEAWESFRAWCSVEGMSAGQGSIRAFSTELDRRGVQSVRTATARRIGLAVSQGIFAMTDDA